MNTWDYLAMGREVKKRVRTGGEAMLKCHFCWMFKFVCKHYFCCRCAACSCWHEKSIQEAKQ